MYNTERALLITAWFLAAYVWSAVAVDVIGVDTNSAQTLSNKTMDSSNLYTLIDYNSTLRIRDIHADSASFSVTHRVHQVTTGSSTITATLAAASGSGNVRDICKADTGSGTVSIARAGSDVIISTGGVSQTARLLQTRGDCVTLMDWKSGEWLSRGGGA